jgi:hypothetical protein
MWELEEGDDGSAIFPKTLKGVVMTLEELPDNVVITQEAIDTITTPVVPVTMYINNERYVVGTGYLTDGPEGLQVSIKLPAGEDTNAAVDRIVSGYAVGFSMSSAPAEIDTTNN